MTLTGVPLSLLAIIALSIGGCAAQSASAPAVDGSFYGVNAQYVRDLSTQGHHEAVEVHLAGIEALGVDFVRANTDWGSLEPLPPDGGRRVYDFTGSDRWVADLAEHGLRWQPTGIGVPTAEWNRSPAAASCGERAPPRPSAFAKMMAALAGRYGPDGSFWEERPTLAYKPVTDLEVWNEANYGIFWCPAPDPARYARVLTATSAAVYRADPAARVMLGGLAGYEHTDLGANPPFMSTADFAREMIAAEPGLTRSVDVLALHPYAADPESSLALLGRVRSQLRAIGFTAPIAVNEIGWPIRGTTGVAPVSEEMRAEYMSELAIAAPACDLVSFAPHTWITPELDPLDPEHWWGIADNQTGEPYATALAYRDAVALVLGGATPPPQDDDTADLCGEA